MELWQRFTHRARRSILLAHDEASAARQHAIDTEHLLAGLARMGEGTAITALTRLGVDPSSLYEDARARMSRPSDERDTEQEVAFTPEAQRVLQRAYELSRERGDPRIGTGHLLLGLLTGPHGGAFVALQEHGVTLERMTEVLEALRREQCPPTIPDRGRADAHERRRLSVRVLQETLREAQETLAALSARIAEAGEVLNELRGSGEGDVERSETEAETMVKQVQSSERIPPAVGPYSQAVRAGDFLFCSGIVALSPDTGKLVEGEFEAEVRQVLDNLRTLLEDCGTGLQHVVKTTVFLADIGQFPEFNSIYAEYFPQDPPARSTVQVAALPLGARIEVEAIALVP